MGRALSNGPLECREEERRRSIGLVRRGSPTSHGPSNRTREGKKEKRRKKRKGFGSLSGLLSPRATERNTAALRRRAHADRGRKREERGREQNIACERNHTVERKGGSEAALLQVLPAELPVLGGPVDERLKRKKKKKESIDPRLGGAATALAW